MSDNSKTIQAAEDLLSKVEALLDSAEVSKRSIGFWGKLLDQDSFPLFASATAMCMLILVADSNAWKLIFILMASFPIASCIIAASGNYKNIPSLGRLIDCYDESPFLHEMVCELRALKIDSYDTKRIVAASVKKTSTPQLPFIKLIYLIIDNAESIVRSKEKTLNSDEVNSIFKNLCEEQCGDDTGLEPKTDAASTQNSRGA